MNAVILAGSLAFAVGFILGALSERRMTPEERLLLRRRRALRKARR